MCCFFRELCGIEIQFTTTKYMLSSVLLWNILIYGDIYKKHRVNSISGSVSRDKASISGSWPRWWCIDHLCLWRNGPSYHKMSWKLKDTIYFVGEKWVDGQSTQFPVANHATDKKVLFDFTFSCFCLSNFALANLDYSFSYIKDDEAITRFWSLGFIIVVARLLAHVRRQDICNHNEDVGCSTNPQRNVRKNIT